jgi:hypothetical protein
MIAPDSATTPVVFDNWRFPERVDLAKRFRRHVTVIAFIIRDLIRKLEFLE